MKWKIYLDITTIADKKRKIKMKRFRKEIKVRAKKKSPIPLKAIDFPPAAPSLIIALSVAFMIGKMYMTCQLTEDST